MANLTETSRWEGGIYQLETSDPVQGGPNGIDNRPIRELANRTRWLYDELSRVKARMDDPNFYKSITVSDSKALFDTNNYLHIGADAAGGYIRNKKTSKGIQLKNDGTLQYDGADVITTRKVSNNPDDYTVATVPSSFALNKAFDNSIKRGGAIGLGGASHQIAIGWDTPGLVAKVDQTLVNVSAPSGTVVALAGEAVPYGWLECNGAAVSRQTYAALFAVIGTRYGAGNGSTTFNLPDLRGEFIRGWDAGRGRDAGRVLGSWQADEFRSHTHGIGVKRQSDVDRGSNSSLVSVDTEGTTDPAGGAETRPMNVAMKYIIKI